jgi:hypothetical protein
MPPLRGFGIILIQDYKDVAPTARKPACLGDFVVIAGFPENRGFLLSIFWPALASFMLIRGQRIFAPGRGVFGVERVYTC